MFDFAMNPHASVPVPGESPAAASWLSHFQPGLPSAQGASIARTGACSRPSITVLEGGGTTDAADGFVILIDSDGKVTTPRFSDPGAPNHATSPWWNICRLLEAPEPAGSSLPGTDRLVAWIDRHAATWRRGPNATASVIIREVFRVTNPLAFGPLLITGGMPRNPVGLTAGQAADALAELLGSDPDDDELSEF